MKNFDLISQFRGYVTKPDVTNTSARLLVEGSKNVLINDEEKVTSREGFTLDGAANASLTPIESSYDWDTDLGTEKNLRAYDDELEWREVASDGTVTWRRVKDSWADVDFVFTRWWDTAEGRELLLFVNGDSNIYEWNGANAYISSTAATTITKTGTDTWAQSGFYTTRNKTVVINGTTYTYTGGETTTTLTGVTPNPTGEANGSVVIQSVITNTNKPAANLKNDVIATLNNQVYVGSNSSNEVYVSKNNSFTTYTFSSPRVPGEGALLTLDSYCTGFVPQEEDMYISSGKHDWFRTKFTLSADTTKEELTIRKLKTGKRGAAQSHDLIFSIKNKTVFVSNEPTLDTLGRIESIDTPQTRPLSDPIKPDFIAATFTNGHGTYFRNQIFISAPTDNNVYIYDLDKGYWQPPQVLPIRRFAIIGGELYGHSSEVPETYKLFTGRNDNANPIAFNATFAYRNYGKRELMKSFDEYYTEGYITSNTKVTLKINYEYQGGETIKEFEIDGGNETYLFGVVGDPSLGKESLGKEPLGSSTVGAEDLRKFRIIHTMSPVPVHEMQVIYTSDSDDGNFQLLSHGANIRGSVMDNTNIKL